MQFFGDSPVSRPTQSLQPVPTCVHSGGHTYISERACIFTGKENCTLERWEERREVLLKPFGSPGVRLVGGHLDQISNAERKGKKYWGRLSIFFYNGCSNLTTVVSISPRIKRKLWNCEIGNVYPSNRCYQLTNHAPYSLRSPPSKQPNEFQTHKQAQRLQPSIE